jgi:hypothetical protein
MQHATTARSERGIMSDQNKRGAALGLAAE